MKYLSCFFLRKQANMVELLDALSMPLLTYNWLCIFIMLLLHT